MFFLEPTTDVLLKKMVKIDHTHATRLGRHTELSLIIKKINQKLCNYHNYSYYQHNKTNYLTHKIRL